MGGGNDPRDVLQMLCSVDLLTLTALFTITAGLSVLELEIECLHLEIRKKSYNLVYDEGEGPGVLVMSE